MERVPVIPATWEAEAEKLLEPRRRRLQRADIMPLYASLVTEEDSKKNKVAGGGRKHWVESNTSNT